MFNWPVATYCHYPLTKWETTLRFCYLVRESMWSEEQNLITFSRLSANVRLLVLHMRLLHFQIHRHMSRQILKKFPNTAASVGHCFPFFRWRHWVADSFAFISNCLFSFSFQSLETTVAILKKVLRHKKTCFFPLMFPVFIDEKKVTLGLILSYKDSWRLYASLNYRQTPLKARDCLVHRILG